MYVYLLLVKDFCINVSILMRWKFSTVTDYKNSWLKQDVCCSAAMDDHEVNEESKS
jgi:hypothetical protein